MGLANLARRHHFSHPGKVGVEAPIEANHQLHTRPAHCRQGPVDVGQIMGDRLFAKDLLACLGRFLDELGMGISGGADQDCINAFVVQDSPIVLVRGRDPKLGCHFFRGLHIDVRDRNQVGLRHTIDQVFGMHAADATSSNKAHLHRTLHNLLQGENCLTIPPSHCPTMPVITRKQ